MTFWLLAFLAPVLACTAHPLDLWYTRVASTPTFYSVAYGNGNFVAVGGSGAIARSTNGSNWSVSNPTAQVLNGVTFGNGKFVAVGYGGTILTSSNAINWENHSPGTNIYLQKIFWGNSRFVAVGYTISPAFSYSLVSTDGVAWTYYFISSYKPTGTFAFGAGLFVFPQTTGTNLLSADGVSWWTKPTGLTNDLYMVGSGGNTLVAFDIRNLTFASLDGTNWTLRGTNTLLRPEELAYGNGFWVAVSRGAQAKYSANLVQWTSVANPLTTAYCTCFGNGTFVTAGSAFCQSAPLVVLQPMTGLPGAITLWGPTGTVYQIQTVEALGAANWQIASNLTVNTVPYVWTDPDTAGHPQKLYRVLLP